MGGSAQRLKTVTVGFFIFLLTAVLVTAFFMEREVPQQTVAERFESSQPVGYHQTSSFSVSKNLQAVVKGSIYENGSNMTVFGVCEDALGYLLPNSTAMFTAWYPNMSVYVGPNSSMTADGDGRFRIHVTMGDVIGTYFTEMRCEVPGEYALAFGEWQNPEWVKKIGDSYVFLQGINGTQQVLLSAIQNVSSQVSALNQTVVSNFSIVISMLNALNSTGGNLSEIIVRLDQMNVSLVYINQTTSSTLSQVTYTQQYLNLTIYPMLQSILLQLGIIDAKLNTTIELQNQTLQIVNGTDQKVDVLVNRSGRPRVWTIQ
jgi:hypothetical protein